MNAHWRVIALALLAVTTSAQAQHRDKNKKSHDFDRDDAEFRLDTTVALSASGTIDLQSFSGDFTIVGWDRDQVKIHGRSRSRVRFDASSSRISLNESPENGRYDDDGDDHEADLGFEISVPKSARLLVRSVSGDVKLTSVADVEAHSVSGDVQANDVSSHAVLETVSGDLQASKVSGGLRASTVSGDIHAQQVTGEVSAQSVSGDVVLGDVTSAYVRLESVSGELHFSGPADPKGRYEFHSHSGDVDLDLTNGGGNATLEVETYSGDLDAGCSMTMRPGDGSDRRGKRGIFTIGNGNGAHFILKTFSGDVHIRGCRSHGEN